MQRDGIANTFLVATGLCVVCSLIVSAAAVGLRPRQKANKDRFQKQNILIAAGESEDDVKKNLDELFKKIETVIIDIDTGEIVSADVVDPNTFDQVKAAKDPALSVEIADGKLAGIARREKYSRVYLLKEGNELKKVILPVYGKGLWSTLYGFISLEKDLNTVAGLTFYEHKETPGLGGEVDNPSWKAKWPGKTLRDDSGEIQVEVVKGQVVEGSLSAIHQVDGLSGATITSRGVSNLIRYWVSEDGFGKYLDKLETGGSDG